MIRTLLIISLTVSIILSFVTDVGIVWSFLTDKEEMFCTTGYVVVPSDLGSVVIGDQKVCFGQLTGPSKLF